MAEYIAPDSMDSIPAWLVFCGRLAPFSSILMFLSPIPTIRHILRTGTVGDLPLLPYTCMVASCFVWVVYGILKGEPIIWTTNLVEFVLSIYYFVEFTNYAPKHSPTFPGSVQRHIQLIVGVCFCSVWIALFFSNAISIIGDLTVLLGIMTFASPLAAVKAVVESESSESIPWPFTLAALFNCALWTVVGIAEMHDVYVSTPEVLGLILILLQVALKLHFGDRMDQDNPAYTRAPVEMPYPVLGSVRQVVMLGSDTGNHHSFFSHNPNDPHDLQFDSNMPNTDFVELGVPLTSSPASLSQTPLPFMPSVNPLLLQPNRYRKGNAGLEYSTVDGLQSVVFDDDMNIAGYPQHPVRNEYSGQGHTSGF